MKKYNLNQKSLALCLLLMSFQAKAEQDFFIKFRSGVIAPLGKTYMSNQQDDIFSGSKFHNAQIFEIGVGRCITKNLSVGITYSQSNIKIAKYNSYSQEKEYGSYNAHLVNFSEKIFNGMNHDHPGITSRSKVSNAALYAAEQLGLNQDIQDANDKTDFANALHKNLKTKVKSRVLLLDSSYAFGENPNLIPYISAGVGVAMNDLKDFNYKDNLGNSVEIKGRNRINIAYQFGAGVKIPINNSMEFDIGTFYYSYGKIKSDSNLKSIMNGEQDNEYVKPLKINLHGFKFTAGVNFSF